MMEDAVEIDGSYGEGGGQVIRTSLTLAAITQKPLRITGIRANRPNPGLQPQHLTACKAVRNVCRGTLEGAEIGSRELAFKPGPIVGGRYDFDIGTAGSVTLVAQALVPILLRASKRSEIRISGGTHVMKSPGYDYFERVFLPAASRFGARINSRMLRPGFYPKGGGTIEVSVEPSVLSGCSAWPHEDHVQAVIRLAQLPPHIGVREKKVFVQNGIGHVSVYEDDALSPGNAVTAWRGLRGAYALGEKGKRAESVAQEALDFLGGENGDVDSHLADQLLAYAALADGPTRYTMGHATPHLRTNAHVIGKFLGRDIRIADGCVEVG